MPKNDTKPRRQKIQESEEPTSRPKRIKRAPLRDVSNEQALRVSLRKGAKKKIMKVSSKAMKPPSEPAEIETTKPHPEEVLREPPAFAPLTIRQMVETNIGDDVLEEMKRPRDNRNKGEACNKRPRRGSLRRSKQEPSTIELRLVRAGRTRSQDELCSDFVQTTDYTMVREPFDASKYTHGVSAFDKPNENDLLEATDYVTDIYQRLFYAERIHQIEDYMTFQPHINSMMRAILVDWLVEVHMKFRLVPETLYLCVNILDRYCSVVQVDRRRLQLVGVTALLIACKYEEIYPPEVRDCVYITDRAYTRQDVLDMEQDIVCRLKFKLTVPTAYPFLLRFFLITSAGPMVRDAANYYVERTLQEYAFIQYRPSLVAAAALCLALNNPEIRCCDNLENAGPGVPAVLLKYTGFSRDSIVEIAELIAGKVGQEIVTASQRQLHAVKRKYDTRKYQHVSTGVINPEVDDILTASQS